MKRQGFTVVELLVVLVLGGLVAAATLRTLVASQQTSTAMAQRMEVQQSTRTGVQYLTSILRELNTRDGDIISMDSGAIRLRAMRWTGLLCITPVSVSGNVVMGIRRSPFYGVRAPDPVLDSLLIYRDGDPETSADDRWLVAGLTASAPSTCADGTPSFLLTLTVTAASGGADSALTGVISGAPIRGFQMEDLELYQSTGDRWWLGHKTANRAGAWTTMQPILGPLASGGLRLSPLDSLGNPVGTTTGIASIKVVVAAESRQRARGGTGTIDFLRDSLVTQVAVRNNPR